MKINGAVYDNTVIIDQTIYTINMSTSYDDHIVLKINLSSKYPGSAFNLNFFDNEYKKIVDFMSDDNYFDTKIVVAVDADYWFYVDEKNSKCVISKYSNTLEDVGFMRIRNAYSYEIKSTGWYDNTLYTGSGLHMTNGLEVHPGQKINYYQVSFNFTRYGYTKRIYVTLMLKK